MPVGRSPAAFLLSLLLLAAGYTQHMLRSAEFPEPSVAIFVAEEYAFEGPDTLSAGWTTVRIHNRGHEPHHIQLLKLTEGKTVAELSSAL